MSVPQGPGQNTVVPWSYPRRFDTAALTSSVTNPNCRYGFVIENDQYPTGYFAIAVVGRDFFGLNPTTTNFAGGAVGGYNILSGQGMGLIFGGPLLTCPPNNIVPLSNINQYIRYVVRFFGAAGEGICYGMASGPNQLLCGSVSNIGNAYLINTGPGLQVVSSISIATPDGTSICRLGPFSGTTDYCGRQVFIAQNYTGNGRPTYVLGCTAQSSIILIEDTPGFCAGGSIGAAQIDGVRATRFNGVANLGQSFDIIYKPGQFPILIIGSTAGNYFLPGGPGVMRAPTTITSVATQSLTSQTADQAGFAVANLGDIFNQGSPTIISGAPSDSRYGTNFGRYDLIFNLTAIVNNLIVPGGITASIGTSIYNTNGAESFGSSAGPIGSSFGAANTPNFVISKLTGNFNGRTASGAAAICLASTALYNLLTSNTSQIYDNLINNNDFGTLCTEFGGATASDDFGWSFANLGSLNPNNTLASVGFGSFGHNSFAGRLSVVFGNKPPQWANSLNNSFALPYGGRVTVSMNNFPFTNLANKDVKVFIFNITASSGGYYAPIGSTTPFLPGTGISYSTFASGFDAVHDGVSPIFDYLAGINVPEDLLSSSLPQQRGTIIPFISDPDVQHTKPIVSAQNQNLLVSSDELFGLQQYNKTDRSQLTASLNCSRVQFFSASQPTAPITNQRIANSDIFNKADNSGIEPACNATFSDGVRTSKPKQLIFDYYPAPKWGNIQFPVKKCISNQPVYISSLPISNIKGSPTNYFVDFPACDHITYFDPNNFPIPKNVSYSSIFNGGYSYSSDCNFPVSCDPWVARNPYGSNSSSSADTYLPIYPPQLQVANFPPLRQAPAGTGSGAAAIAAGSCYQVKDTMLRFTCDLPCNATTLQYTSSSQNAAFTTSDCVTPFPQFSEADKQNGRVYWASTVPDGAPFTGQAAVNVTATDTVHTMSTTTSATASLLGQPFVASLPDFPITQGSCTPLPPISIADNFSPPSAFGLTITSTIGGTLNANVTGNITQLATPYSTSLSAYNQNRPLLCDDGAVTPGTGYCFFGSNAIGNTTLICVPARETILHPRPTNINAAIIIQQALGTTPITLTTSIISFAPGPLDTETTFNNIRVVIYDVVDGHLIDKTLTGNQGIAEYLQSKQATGAIQFIPTGPNPSFKAIGYSIAGKPNAEGPIIFSKAAGTLTYIPDNTPPGVDICQFVLPQAKMVQLSEQPKPAGTPQATLLMSTPSGDPNALRALLSNNPYLNFYYKNAGSTTLLSTTDPILPITRQNITAGNMYVATKDTFFNNQDIGFNAGAINGNNIKSTSQPCATQFLPDLLKPAIIDKQGVDIQVSAGGFSYITNSKLSAIHENPTIFANLTWNANVLLVYSGGSVGTACRLQLDYQPMPLGQSLTNFPNSALGVNGNRPTLQVVHDGTLDANGDPIQCAINATVTTPYGVTTGPITIPIQVTRSQSIINNNGTSFAVLSAGNVSAAGVAVAVVLLVARPIVNKILDIILTNEMASDPIVLQATRNSKSSIKMSGNCCYVSNDLARKWAGGVRCITTEMAKQGIQTHTNYAFEKCCACLRNGCSCSGNSCCGSKSKEQELGSAVKEASTNSAADLKTKAEDTKTKAENPLKAQLNPNHFSPAVLAQFDHFDELQSETNKSISAEDIITVLRAGLLQEEDITTVAEIMVNCIKDEFNLTGKGGWCSCNVGSKLKSCCCCLKDVTSNDLETHASAIATRIKLKVEKQKPDLLIEKIKERQNRMLQSMRLRNVTNALSSPSSAAGGSELQPLLSAVPVQPLVFTPPTATTGVSEMELANMPVRPASHSNPPPPPPSS